MLYWLDTEFIEDGRTIDLISIGIVSEDGRELYFQNYDCDLSKANDWVKENVIPHLEGDPATKTESDRWKTKAAIRDSIIRYFGWSSSTPHFEAEWLVPQIWGYYADYDWVVFCQIFGKMMDLPAGFPMYCRDIKQLCDELGNPRLPTMNKGEHHALADARWNKEAWKFLVKNPRYNG